MHQVLVYADSLSWGIIPGTRQRLAFDKRWPGVLEVELNRLGTDVRIIEDCLNGRRTVLDDPTKSGRNGLEGLEQRIEVNSPLSLALLFLGTNDFQAMHQFDARQSAQGLQSLVSAIRRAPIEPGMPTPEILLIAPPPIQEALGSMAVKFLNAESKSAGLNKAIRDVALSSKCEFFDSGDVIETSSVDGVHLDRLQHKLLGNALVSPVTNMLAESRR